MAVGALKVSVAMALDSHSRHSFAFYNGNDRKKKKVSCPHYSYGSNRLTGKEKDTYIFFASQPP